MLKYKNVLDKNNEVKQIKVMLNKKKIGTIKITKSTHPTKYHLINSFQYFPKGSKKGSDVFVNLRELQMHIEEE